MVIATAVLETAREPKGNTARRQQVIDAAAATFSRLGYHGASTRAIADALGIKVASFYFHIASKEDALEEICAHGTRRSMLYIAQALEAADDLAERVRHFFCQQREDFVANADYVSVAIHEGRHLPELAKQRLGQLSGQFRGVLDGMFAEAAARGELHPAITPRQARFVLVAAMRSISELYVSGRIRDFDVIMSGWVEATIRALVAEYRPPE